MLRYAAFGDVDIMFCKQSLFVRFSWRVEESNVLGRQSKAEQKGMVVIYLKCFLSIHKRRFNGSGFQLPLGAVTF